MRQRFSSQFQCRDRSPHTCPRLLRRLWAHRLRSAEPCREYRLRRPRARTDQQPDHLAAERGADADQSGTQPHQPALFRAAGPAAIGATYAAATGRGTADRL